MTKLVILTLCVPFPLVVQRLAHSACRHSIVITGFVVLAGGTKLQDPTANFRHIFDNSTSNGNDIARSFVKILCAFHGPPISHR